VSGQKNALKKKGLEKDGRSRGKVKLGRSTGGGNDLRNDRGEDSSTPVRAKKKGKNWVKGLGRGSPNGRKQRLAKRQWESYFKGGRGEKTSGREEGEVFGKTNWLQSWNCQETERAESYRPLGHAARKKQAKGNSGTAPPPGGGTIPRDCGKEETKMKSLTREGG